MARFLGRTRAEALIHLAAIPSPRFGEPFVVFATNTQATFAALEAAGIVGLPRVALASSTSVTGLPFGAPGLSPRYVPVDEDHPNIGSDAYALSKEADEATARTMHRRHGYQVVALRISNTAPMAEQLERAAEVERDPAVLACELWAYLDVRDAARAFRLAVERDLPGCHVINVMAPDTNAREATAELLARYHPTTELRRADRGSRGPVRPEPEPRAAGFRGGVPSARAEAPGMGPYGPVRPGPPNPCAIRARWPRVDRVEANSGRPTGSGRRPVDPEHITEASCMSALAAPAPDASRRTRRQTSSASSATRSIRSSIRGRSPSSAPPRRKAGSAGRSCGTCSRRPFGGTVYPVNPTRPAILGRQGLPVDRGDRRAGRPGGHRDARRRRRPGLIEECGAGGRPRRDHHQRRVQGDRRRRASSSSARSSRRRAGTASGSIGPNCLGRHEPGRRPERHVRRRHRQARSGRLHLARAGALLTAILDWSCARERRLQLDRLARLDARRRLGRRHRLPRRRPAHRRIVIYMETIGDARAFLSAAREVALTKPIIVIKPGRTAQAAKAAASHTGSLTGSDDVLDAAFRRAGVLRVDSISELFAWSRRSWPSSRARRAAGCRS